MHTNYILVNKVVSTVIFLLHQEARRTENTINRGNRG